MEALGLAFVGTTLLLLLAQAAESFGTGPQTPQSSTRMTTGVVTTRAHLLVRYAGML